MMIRKLLLCSLALFLSISCLPPKAAFAAKAQGFSLSIAKASPKVDQTFQVKVNDPTGSKAILQAAIDSAKAVAAQGGATLQQVNQAIAQLQAALQAFTASVNVAVAGDLKETVEKLTLKTLYLLD